MKKLLLVLIVLFFSTNIYAETFYVTADGTGDPTWPSSHVFSPSDFDNSSNWDTDVDDDNKIGPGDTVILSGINGPLKDNNTDSSPYSVLHIRGDGWKDESTGTIYPITITADQNNLPVIDGSEPISNWDWEEIAWMPRSANPWDNATDDSGTLMPQVDGVTDAVGSYTYAEKVLSGNYTEITCNFKINPYFDCDNGSIIKILSLQDNATNESAWLELKGVIDSQSNQQFYIRYSVRDDSGSQPAPSTGWEYLGKKFWTTFLVPHEVTLTHVLSDNSTVSLQVNESTYEINGIDNNEQGFDRILMGAIGFFDTITGDDDLQLGYIHLFGNDNEGANIYRTTRWPAMLWDTKGTDNYSDDIELRENPNLLDLSDTESGWWFEVIQIDGNDYEDYITYLKLPEGQTPATADIVATVANGIYAADGSEGNPYKYINIDGDTTSDGGQNRILFEKCGYSRTNKYWSMYAGGFVSKIAPMNHFNISDCEFNRNIAAAIYLEKGGNNCTIHHNKIDISLPVWGRYGGMGSGIRVLDESLEKNRTDYHPTNFEIYENEVSRCHHPGIGLSGGDNMSIHDNYLHDLPAPRPDDGSSWVNYCQGNNIHIELEEAKPDGTTGYLNGLDIYNNLIVDTGKGITFSNYYETQQQSPALKNVTIKNNIISGTDHPTHGAITIKGTYNASVYNNTILSPNGDGIYLKYGIVNSTLDENILIKNNIISNPGRYMINAIGYSAARPVQFESDYNCLYDATDPKYLLGADNKTQSQWIDSTEYDNNSQVTNPLIADQENDDYTLLPGSPCIDTGNNTGDIEDDFYGTVRPKGNNIDIGAIEYWDLLFKDTFTDGEAGDWSFDNGTWAVTNGRLEQSTNVGHAMALQGSVSWQNYTVSADMTTTDDDFMGLVFRYQDSDNYYYFYMSSQQSLYSLLKVVNGTTTVIASETGGYTSGETYRVEVAIQGNSIKVYVDDNMVIDETDSALDKGKIGLITKWCTDTSFDNIEVWGAPLFHDTFTDGEAGDWTFSTGSWSVANGQLEQSTNDEHAMALQGSVSWQNYTVSADMSSTDDDFMGLVFRYQDSDNYYYFYMSSQQSLYSLLKVVDGSTTVITSETGGYTSGETYRVEVVLQGTGIKVYVDGVQVIDETDSALDKGKIGLITKWCTDTSFDNVEVWGIWP